VFLEPTLTRRVPGQARHLGAKPWFFRVLSVLPVLCCFGFSPATRASAQNISAVVLLAKYNMLTEQLNHNDYQRPLYMESSESSNALKGDIYAVVAYPFAAVETALSRPDNWCEALLLHINNRQCQVAQTGDSTSVVTLSVVRKYDQPIEQAYRLPFVYRKESKTLGYLATRLSADSGPMGTSNHQILLEAIPLPGNRSFLHFAYSYDSNFIAQATLQAYLSTFGSAKIGFSLVTPEAVAPNSNGELSRELKAEPLYIRGARGLMERNAMRYYLAIDAYIANASGPANEQQLSQRLDSWFTQSERYPKQLHETDRANYLRLKTEDYAVMHSHP